MTTHLDDQDKATKYAIYARKSTDSGEKQTRSIDDQISECKALAERLDLKVVGEPIIEEISAMKPFKRPLFKKLMKDIKEGRINGIISWHPDRLARNMIEGGMIIQAVDDGLILDLKFVSYTFTNDASGKLALGIAFSISKHYSDKLSVDVRRGMLKSLKEGKSAGQYKPGY